MRDEQSEMRISATDDEAVVVRFASRVVALLASRADVDALPLREDMLQLLEAACHDDDPGRLPLVLSEFRRNRIPAAVLADRYIPDVARRLGAAWLDDSLSFAEVSMGAARLQGVLREVGALWGADAPAGADGVAKGRACEAGSVLLIVPGGEQHTLGAMVAMGRLRRLGVSVCLRFAPTKAELAHLLQDRVFDGVFLSLSCSGGIEVCRRLVTAIRTIAGPDLPVIIGGAIMGLEADVAGRTGADAATDDLEAGLRACNLLTSVRAPRRRA
jgi:MerR family transcriptional regulator, light-induced transcriptional regulator